ncbi:hypothetical protein [Sphingobium chungbukense]|uniref:hypothetical protein n=1 Tax=Sphingobium chungbukense TaxID=56193 RepID=UPI000A8AA028|nr:hypothetical protein [Sphingobium chungbukense]
MRRVKERPGQYRARNINGAGRRVYFARPRSWHKDGGVNGFMRKFMADFMARLGS